MATAKQITAWVGLATAIVALIAGVPKLLSHGPPATVGVAPSSYDFSGVVRNALDLRPIEGAHVLVSQDQSEPEEHYTDSNGVFRLQIRPATKALAITVESAGYKTRLLYAPPSRTSQQEVRLTPAPISPEKGPSLPRTAALRPPPATGTRPGTISPATSSPREPQPGVISATSDKTQPASSPKNPAPVATPPRASAYAEVGLATGALASLRGVWKQSLRDLQRTWNDRRGIVTLPPIPRPTDDDVQTIYDEHQTARAGYMAYLPQLEKARADALLCLVMSPNERSADDAVFSAANQTASAVLSVRAIRGQDYGENMLDPMFTYLDALHKKLGDARCPS